MSRYTPASFGRARRRCRAVVPLLLGLLVFVAGLSITIGGWMSWRDSARGPHHLAAIIVGVLVAALGFSAAGASVAGSLSAGGSHAARRTGEP